jgi:hypothetical protein
MTAALPHRPVDPSDNSNCTYSLKKSGDYIKIWKATSYAYSLICTGKSNRLRATLSKQQLEFFL